MTSAAPDISLSATSVLAARCLRAAQTCWDVEDNSVILLHSEGCDERNLRGQLQALGLAVFSGADCRDIGPFPVIVIDARAWQHAEIRQQADSIRRRRPQAAICVVTGLLAARDPSRPAQHPIFDDARAHLQAAGFGFFSIGGASHELSA